MAESQTHDDRVTEQMKLMLEVVSLRKRAPPKLVEIDKRIQKLELYKMMSEECSLDAVQCRLAEYKNEKYPDQQMTISDWDQEFTNAKNVLKKVEELEIVLQEKIRNRVDVTGLLKKVDSISEKMSHANAAYKQIQNEDPLFKQARLDAMCMMHELQGRSRLEQVKADMTKQKNEEMITEELGEVTRAQIKEETVTEQMEVETTRENQ